MIDYLGMAIAENALLRKKLRESTLECAEWTGRYLDAIENLGRMLHEENATDDEDVCRWTPVCGSLSDNYAECQPSIACEFGSDFKFCPFCGKKVQHD